MHPFLNGWSAKSPQWFLSEMKLRPLTQRSNSRPPPKAASTRENATRWGEIPEKTLLTGDRDGWHAAEACGPDSVAHEHGDGHGADAAGNRSKKSGRVKGVGMNVADKHAALFAEFVKALGEVFQQARRLGGIGNFVGADIDDGSSRADPVGLYVARFAHGRDDNIGATHEFREISRFGVADSDRSVCVHEKESHGLADDVAAAQNDRVGALDRNLVAPKNFHASGGSAGDESRAIGNELAEIDGMKAINVFRGVYGFQYALGIDLRRERELNKDPVNVVVIVQIGNELKHVAGGNIRGRRVKPMSQAELFAGRDLAFDVNVRGRILSNENSGKAGTSALGVKAGDVLFELSENFIPDFQAIKSLSGHEERIT
jgi:hypothetical protein